MQRFSVHSGPLSPTADACGSGLRLTVYQIGDKHLTKASWDADRDFVEGPQQRWPDAIHFPALEAFAHEVSGEALAFLEGEGVTGAEAAVAYKVDGSGPMPTTKVINMLRGLRDKYGIPYEALDISPES